MMRVIVCVKEAISPVHEQEFVAKQEMSAQGVEWGGGTVVMVLLDTPAGTLLGLRRAKFASSCVEAYEKLFFATGEITCT
jgi:hypothetical protein